MSKPPEQFVFFLDRALGKRILASALRREGLRVEVHEDHFPSDARDEHWLPEVGSRGWVVLTKDRQIRYRHLELGALIRSGVRAFAFTRGDLTAEEMAKSFLVALPSIRKLLASRKGPFVATVTRGGDVRIIFERHPRR